MGLGKFGDHGVQEFSVLVYYCCIVFGVLSASEAVLGFIDNNANEQSRCGCSAESLLAGASDAMVGVRKELVAGVPPPRALKIVKILHPMAFFS